MAPLFRLVGLAAAGAAVVLLLADYGAQPGGTGLTIEPLRLNAGRVSCGSRVSAEYRAVNRSSLPVRVVGLESC
jgi:hypothetical protein